MSERLLFALSAKASMKHEELYNIMSREWSAHSAPQALGSDKRLEVMRLLEAMAYAEIDWENRKIFAVPPAWALLPHEGLPAAVLTGGRSPGMMKDVRAAVRRTSGKIELREEPRYWAGAPFPTFVLARASSAASLIDFCKATASLAGEIPAAWSLSNASASLEEIRLTLRFSIQKSLNWPRRIFDLDKLVFLPSTKTVAENPGLSAFINPSSQARMHVAWGEDTGAEIARDWGRYYALASAGRQVLFYDQQAMAMAVPATAPLPAILQRALALCSGEIPLQDLIRLDSADEGNAVPYSIFFRVPPAIASLVAGKLGQSLRDWTCQGAKRSELCLTAIR